MVVVLSLGHVVSRAVVAMDGAQIAGRAVIRKADLVPQRQGQIGRLVEVTPVDLASFCGENQAQQHEVGAAVAKQARKVRQGLALLELVRHPRNAHQLCWRVATLGSCVEHGPKWVQGNARHVRLGSVEVWNPGLHAQELLDGGLFGGLAPELAQGAEVLLGIPLAHACEDGVHQGPDLVVQRKCPGGDQLHDRGGCQHLRDASPWVGVRDNGGPRPEDLDGATCSRDPACGSPQADADAAVVLLGIRLCHLLEGRLQPRFDAIACGRRPGPRADSRGQAEPGKPRRHVCWPRGAARRHRRAGP
mmetsp:Transcript_96390/g.215918  ORF Transcript_96390/g.215918 Transcript_96390/m.215918 type:complete len:304 (-) Transcript_96390:14-925(-)